MADKLNWILNGENLDIKKAGDRFARLPRSIRIAMNRMIAAYTDKYYVEIQVEENDIIAINFIVTMPAKIENVLINAKFSNAL